MNPTTYGLDIATRILQMYWVDAQTGEIANRRFLRDELIAFLAQRPAGCVALEACRSAHWWVRKIRALGVKRSKVGTNLLLKLRLRDSEGVTQEEALTAKALRPIDVKMQPHAKDE